MQVGPQKDFRNENGGAVNQHIKNNLQELTLDDCIDIPHDFIAQLHTMYMCGNLGDSLVPRYTRNISMV